MTTAYTSLLGLALPVTGELSGTWGDVVNNSITSLVDTSVAGTTNISTDANVTLTTTTGAANQARQAILLFSGARTAERTVTAPAQSKIYTVINATTGGYAVKLVGSGPTTGVTIANGARTVVAWNGSDFVEVSSPSSIILPNGTANGVLYLNGSKVVTSGSALTFDGTNFATTGNIRSSGANGNIGATGTTGNATLALQTNARLWTIGTSNSDSALYWRDETASAELMRLTSTGLGIGTSSPAARLSVVTASANSTAATIGGIEYGGSKRGLTIKTYQSAGGDDCGVEFNAANGLAGYGAFKFAANTTTLATIDSSGNLGLGVTPSAWTTVTPVFQIGTGSFYAYSNEVRLNSNFFFNGADRYIQNGFATSYNQASGQHKWFNAPSGTAGNSFSFTQAMTLDASGNLLVGTTSATYSASGRGLVEVNGSSTSLLALKTGGSAAGYVYHDGTEMSVVNTKAGSLQFSTNGSERARIDSSGNLLVGTTSSNTKLDVRQTNNSYNATYFAHSGNAAGVSVFDATNTSFVSSVIALDSYTTAGTGWKFMSCYSSAFASERLFIRGDGNVYNTNGTYGAISDVKLKENITDATSKLAQLNQVRVVNYNLIGDDQKQIGVIAQELEQIFPSMVDETPDKDREGNDLGTTTKAVKYSVFVPMLIKAMQEQQAIIESLKARLDAANL